MRIATATALYAYGTSEGAEKAWDTRGRGRAPRPTVPHLNRSALSKQFYSRVTPEKIQAAKESVQRLAAALGKKATVTSDSHPWDILFKGTQVGVEVKRLMPDRKNLRAVVHSGEKSGGSKERKVEFADKHNMKRMYVVAHDTHIPGQEKWFVRRAGDRGDPRSDPKDKRTGWSYNIDKMHGGASTPEGIRGLIK